MDHTGMYPAHPCKQCGRQLNADGDHPAELYAGTYTGLCYQCERSGERLLAVARLDGAETWEFPPHCPSWRRARERFIGFTGCAECGGKGRLWVGRADAQGGSYSKQCEACSARFWGHPLRKWEQQRWGRIRQAAESEYRKELRRLKLLRLAEQGKADKDRIRAVQAPFVARMERVRARFQGMADKRLMRGAEVAKAAEASAD